MKYLFQPLTLASRSEGETKLQVLRDKLKAGENSPLVENFNSADFIEGLHKKAS